MSYRTGPKIVTDGLVLCLDAADRNSYPLSGSTWYDLSENKRNGTISNATYNSMNRGVIAFDGSSDKVEGTLSSGLNAPFTLEYFGRFNNATQYDYEYFGSVGNTGSSTMISVSKIGTRLGQSAYYGNMYLYTGETYAVFTDISLANTNWVHLVAVTTTSAPYAKVYKNAVEGNILAPITGVSTSINGAINTNSTYRIGTWQNSTWWLNGQIGFHRIYNRALTSDEITQNYNATKGRFGL
jgi:hypothetical protein